MSKKNGTMFGLNGNANSRANGNGNANGQRPGVRTVLGPGCRVEGKLVCAGPTRLDGCVEGEVVADEFLLIDRNSTVIADLNVGELVVRGKVKGDIRVTKRVALGENADVEGDIVTPSIAISDGAHFKGRVEVSCETPAETDVEEGTLETEAEEYEEKMSADKVGAVIREYTQPEPANSY